MECLIPDILFTLLGHKSEVLHSIVDNDSNYTDDEYVLLNTEDRCLLKRFLSLAEEYQKLNVVVKTFSRLQSIDRQPDANKTGIYFEAFVDGIFIALQPYRKCIIKIEKELPSNKKNQCLLAETLRKVEQHKPLMVTINGILEQIELSRLHGGQILNVLHEAVNFKFMDDKVQLTLVFKQCLQVKFKFSENICFYLK